MRLTIFLTLILALCAVSGSAQPSLDRQLSNNLCEYNKSVLASVSALFSEAVVGSKLIIVSKLGKGELSEQYSQARIQRLLAYLKYSAGVSEDKIVTSRGESSHDLACIEIYVSGKLATVIRLGKKQNIDFGSNGACDGERNLIIRIPPKVRKKTKSE